MTPCQQQSQPNWCADIGMEEAGLAEAIAAAVQAAHPHLHGLLWSNVLLTGAWRGGRSACSWLLLVASHTALP